MATWTNDTCGYCGYSDTNLNKYTCPLCKRLGCPDCMPNGSSQNCPFCVEEHGTANDPEDLISSNRDI